MIVTANTTEQSIISNGQHKLTINYSSHVNGGETVKIEIIGLDEMVSKIKTFSAQRERQSKEQQVTDDKTQATSKGMLHELVENLDDVILSFSQLRKYIEDKNVK